MEAACKAAAINKRTVRGWFANDAKFQDTVLQSAKRAGRRLVPEALTQLKNMMISDNTALKKFAVEKILEINGLIKKGSVNAPINAPAKVVVNMGLDDEDRGVEVTEADIQEAENVMDAIEAGDDVEADPA